MVARARYRNPDNPDLTWTGKGRMPHWVKVILDTGKNLADFQIKYEDEKVSTWFPLKYVPTVHLNGTSKEALVEQQKEIHEAATNLLKKLADATPHDRDYYVQKNPKAGAEARAAHRLLLCAVRDIMDEAEARAIAIQEQGE